MTCLTADIGNTFTKLGLFAQNKLIANTSIETAQLSKHKWLEEKKWHAYKAVVYCNVSSYANALPAHKQIMQVSASIPLPIKILYDAPETLGADRIADVCGANAEFKNANCLIINFGTCITINLLTKNAEYKGGSIMPGTAMQFSALHEYTGRLPKINQKNKDFKFPGQNTEDCMQAGVLQGVLWQLESLLAWFENNYDGGKVIFTGGDTTFFAHSIKSNIFARPKLSLYGLWEILKYNLSNLQD